MRQRNVSANTIASYRDTFRRLFTFAQARLRKPPSALTLDDLEAPLVGAFLADLETERGAGVIRLSDKTSRLHPRHVVPKPTQAYEPEMPVKVRERIAPALASPGFVLDAQPPAQPHSGVLIST